MYILWPLLGMWYVGSNSAKQGNMQAAETIEGNWGWQSVFTSDQELLFQIPE